MGVRHLKEVCQLPLNDKREEDDVGDCCTANNVFVWQGCTVLEKVITAAVSLFHLYSCRMLQCYKVNKVLLPVVQFLQKLIVSFYHRAAAFLSSFPCSAPIQMNGRTGDFAAMPDLV